MPNRLQPGKGWLSPPRSSSWLGLTPPGCPGNVLRGLGNQAGAGHLQGKARRAGWPAPGGVGEQDGLQAPLQVGEGRVPSLGSVPKTLC